MSLCSVLRFLLGAYCIKKFKIKPGTLIFYKQIFQECYFDLECLQTAGFWAITQSIGHYLVTSCICLECQRTGNLHWNSAKDKMPWWKIIHIIPFGFLAFLLLFFNRNWGTVLLNWFWHIVGSINLQILLFQANFTGRRESNTVSEKWVFEVISRNSILMFMADAFR